MKYPCLLCHEVKKLDVRLAAEPTTMRHERLEDPRCRPPPAVAVPATWIALARCPVIRSRFPVANPDKEMPCSFSRI